MFCVVSCSLIYCSTTRAVCFESVVCIGDSCTVAFLSVVHSFELIFLEHFYLFINVKVKFLCLVAESLCK
jgi:hypothetical protein